MKRLHALELCLRSYRISHDINTRRAFCVRLIVRVKYDVSRAITSQRKMKTSLALLKFTIIIRRGGIKKQFSASLSTRTTTTTIKRAWPKTTEHHRWRAKQQEEAAHCEESREFQNRTRHQTIKKPGPGVRDSLRRRCKFESLACHYYSAHMAS